MVLAQARAGGQGLSANDWRLLAFYSWETDEQQLVAKDGVPALLKLHAQACPADQTETSTRLRLKALAATDEKAPARPDPAAEALLVKLLADPAASRAHMDLLTNDAAEITVVDPAIAPWKAQWPRYWILLASSLFVGALLGILAAGSATILADWRGRNPATAHALSDSLAALPFPLGERRRRPRVS